MTQTMPALFIGHGNPMNAVQRNSFTEGWGHLGRSLQQPKAVLCISAHWYTTATAVTAMPVPRTIHDFGGFPRELYQVQYAAPGDVELARYLQQILLPLRVMADQDWGLDHGTWSVLRHIFPDADVPVLQLSIDERQPPAFHYELGRRLRSLRNQGILLIGSGDIVHNLHTYAWGDHPVEPYDWAVRFEAHARELLLKRQHAPLIDYGSLGKDAALSIPTPEHYLPLLYVLGASFDSDAISFPIEGMDGGSVSMLAVQFGGAPS